MGCRDLDEHAAGWSANLPCLPASSGSPIFPNPRVAAAVRKGRTHPCFVNRGTNGSTIDWSHDWRSIRHPSTRRGGSVIDSHSEVQI